MKDLVINSTIQHTLLLFIPLIFAYVLKIAKVRRWSILGGVLGGIILGPAVFGSAAPEYWDGIFQGGVHEQALYRQLERQQEADVAAAVKLGVSDSFILQLKAQQHEQLIEPKANWKAGQWRDQRTLRDYAIALIFLILLSGSMRQQAKGLAPPLTMLSVGVWAAIIPGGLLAALSYWLWGTPATTALAFGATLAVGPWTLQKWEQKVADEGSSQGAALMLKCGRVAWVVASGVALYVTWNHLGAMSLVWLLPLILLPIIWIFRARNWKWLTIFVEYAAIPSVMATALVLIHPFEEFSLWPTLIVILLCADGRWLGGIVGLSLLGGYTSERVMKLSIPLVDSGISQLCLTGLLFGAGVLPAPFALAALIGTVFLECTAPIRMKFAKNKLTVD
ncbi:MAG: hypothetical protein HOC27_06935 [Phycisphaerae bacterium]|jgi:hypothetical protein|nr:hypothetical protein [Phycisphaerae bacterium]